MWHANLEFMLLKLENAAIQVQVLSYYLRRIRLMLLLTGVDAHVSSSSLPFFYNTAE